MIGGWSGDMDGKYVRVSYTKNRNPVGSNQESWGCAGVLLNWR